MATQIQIRRDSTANWTNLNPILAQGELGLDLNVNNIKVGNGLSAWNVLPYQFTTGTDFNSYKTDVTSATASNINYVHTNFFPLTGGIISGNTRINNNLTVWGNLSATGTQTFANTIFSTTSALSVFHVGSGPAMWVGNYGDGDIASFYDTDANIEVLHVGGNTGTFPNVGIKTSTPNKTLTVAGEISATQDITTSGKINTSNSNSDEWHSVYSNVQSNSAVFANVQSNSAKWIKSDTSLVTSTPAPSALFNIVALSQVAYDSLSPNYSSTTLYVIV